MTCWSAAADSPLHICQATVGQIVVAYPGLADWLKVLVVFTAVTALGVWAAVTLVTWRRRQRVRHQVPVDRSEPVRYARGVAPARRHTVRPRALGRVYPVSCSEETVVLRRPRRDDSDDRESSCARR